MGIAYGVSPQWMATNDKGRKHAATKASVQDGLVLNLDAGVNDSYSGTGSSWIDLVGNDNATLTNGPTFNSQNGGSIVLDGTDDYIITNTEKADFTTVNEITLSIFCKMSPTATGKGALQFGLNLTENTPWILFQLQSGYLRWYVNSNYRMNQSYTSGQIYNFTLTYSSNLWSCYKDGSFDTSYSGGIGSDGGENFFIGTGYNGYNSMTVYNCQIYNRALTAAEVSRNFNVMRHRFGI